MKSCSKRSKGNAARLGAAAALLFIGATVSSNADDWPRFRGTEGAGISGDRSIPLKWGDGQNLAWKAPLPGPGNSSPIVFNGRVFITSYSGYGLSKEDPGSPQNLKRHLQCFKADTGKLLWKASIDAELPEDPYAGYLTEHGYASNTPVTDGQRVYAFLGKSGALAFDFKTGKELWRVNLGMESGNRRWGSAASPVLYKDMVIVTASEESQTVRALKKDTGKEVWRAEGSRLELVYSTPRLIDAGGGRQDLIVSAVNEVWGLNPDNGKMRWLAETRAPGNICPSVVYDGETIYAFGGYPRRVASAIKAGGKGDVTGSHIRWTNGNSPYIPTPVLRDGHLYWVDRSGKAQCLKAATGETVFHERLQGEATRIQVYASPVIVGDRIIAVTRNAGVYVLDAKPEFKQLAQNVFRSDDSEFCGTPAIADGRLFLRSHRAIYCIAASDRAQAQGQQPALLSQ